MASGKLSPRQRLINLMYMVFIAMIAMNMSKEVLSAFGILNEKLEASNVKAEADITSGLTGLAKKASDQTEKFQPLLDVATKIKSESDTYSEYLDGLKAQMLEGVEDPKDYQVMDKGDFLDKLFFEGENYTPAGEDFLQKLTGYKNSVISTLKSTKQSKPLSEDKEFLATLENRFGTSDVPDREGVPVPYLKYHYEGYPLISSLAKITQLQGEIKTTEKDVINSLTQGQLESDVSMTNYDAMVLLEKGAYYPGEQLSGKIVLGKNDPTLKASKVVVNGRNIPESQIKAGQVVLNGPVGNVGEKELKGEFVFKENGEDVSIPIAGSYVVIPRPNGAIISADKMNVVYRGLPNPMSITIPGISPNKIQASAPGLTRQGKGWVIKPQSGREVKISVTGTMDDGGKVTDSKLYRIKDIPRPVGSIRKETGKIKMSKSNLEISSIGAELEDFDFDVKLKISSFKFSVPGQPSVQVRGNKLNSRAKSLLKRAKRGQTVQIFEIKAQMIGNSGYKLKQVNPVFVEITN